MGNCVAVENDQQAPTQENEIGFETEKEKQKENGKDIRLMLLGIHNFIS